MKILFVCSANRLRSLTADHLFRKLKPEHEYKSCGTDVINEKFSDTLKYRYRGDNPISDKLVEWADVIFCMQKHHADFITETYGSKTKDKIRVAGIPDEFDYRDRRLIWLLKRKIKI
jgi:predicted protein tyrosine phosphatase